MQYLYESHMGGFYTTNSRQDYEDIYCESCGDSDFEIGGFSNEKELWELVKPYLSINGSGGHFLITAIECLFSELLPKVNGKKDNEIIAIVEKYLEGKRDS